MTYSFDGDNYILVLKKDESFIDSLLEFTKTTNVKSAWVSGLGAALGVELGYYNLEKRQYQWRQIVQLCEIVSLTGNISQDSEKRPAFHFHGVFADDAYQTIGGHVKEFIAGGTVELYIAEFGRPLHRQFDERTGLKLLHL